MFNHLLDFSRKRNWKEAVGFYLAFLLLVIIIGAIAGAVSSLWSGGGSFADNFDQGAKVGNVIGVLSCLLISFLLLKEKKLHKNFGFILLALTSGLLAIFVGALLGLIIPAIITTKDKV